MTDFFGNTTDINDGVTDQFFEYNWERNLTQAYLDESYSDTHEYDGNGRRMRSKLNSAANWTHFVHDELTEQVLCEFTLVSSTFTLKAANTYGWGLISSSRDGGDTKRYFHFDGLGNTVALTDSSGDVQDTYVWTAFGLPLSSTRSSVNPYRYVGQWGYYDDGAMGSPHDFVLCGVRYYAPRYGRFLTWDPIGERGYEYCYNTVTMTVDPTGRIALVDDLIVSSALCIVYVCVGWICTAIVVECSKGWPGPGPGVGNSRDECVQFCVFLRCSPIPTWPSTVEYLECLSGCLSECSQEPIGATPPATYSGDMVRRNNNWYAR